MITRIKQFDVEARLLLIQKGNDSSWISVPAQRVNPSLTEKAWKEACTKFVDSEYNALNAGASQHNKPSKETVKDLKSVLKKAEGEASKRDQWKKRADSVISFSSDDEQSNNTAGPGSKTNGSPALTSQQCVASFGEAPLNKPKAAASTKSNKRKTSKKGKGSRKNSGKISNSSSANVPQPPPEPVKDFRFGPVTVLEFERDIGGCGVPGDGSWALALGDKVFAESCMSLEAHEAEREGILVARTAKLTKKERRHCRGETRQWDYRGVDFGRNPLFGRLCERERRGLLMEQMSASSHAFELSAAGAKELDDIRKSRAAGGGCSCAPLRPDKLTVKKLKEELKLRGLSVEGSRKDLQKSLQVALHSGEETISLCGGNACECAREEIECHADLCGCYKGHRHGHSDDTGGKCCNPHGIYAYSAAKVDTYRRQFTNSSPSEAASRDRSYSDVGLHSTCAVESLAPTHNVTTHKMGSAA